MVIPDYSWGRGVTKRATLNVRRVRALAEPREAVDSNNPQDEMESDATGLHDVAAIL
jgi:hypothetical protein